MTTQIRIRRGTKSQLNTVMAGGTPLVSGELGFTTDTKEVFVSDGAAVHLVGKVLVGLLASRPAAGVSGRLFHATDDLSTWVDNGSTWRDVSGGISDLDDVSDGTTYGKVLNTYLSANRPDGLWDGTAKLTGATLKAHLDNLTKHREINDSGSASTDLWSADKIASSIDQAITGMDFQADVENIQTDAVLNPGASPVLNTRYIISNTAALHANFGTIFDIGTGDIVTFNGTGFVVAYDVSVEGEGVLVWNKANDTYLKYDGSAWAEFGGLAGVVAGDGLTKSGNTINAVAGDGIAVVADSIAVDVTDIVGTGVEDDGANNIRLSAQGYGLGGGNGAVLNVKPDVTTGDAVAPIAVTVNGVGVTIDNNSIGHTGGSIEVRKVDGGTFV